VISRLFRCVAMATKKRGLIQRLFGSKKTSFESIGGDDDNEMAVVQAFQTSTRCGRRHTVDVETFRGELADKALMAAAAERHRSDMDYGGLLSRLYSQITAKQSSIVTTRQRRSADVTSPKKTKSTAAKLTQRPTTTSEKTISVGDDVEGELHKSSSGGSFRRRITRRDRLLRSGGICPVDTTEPIVYPTTPEMILEYHKVPQRVCISVCLFVRSSI